MEKSEEKLNGTIFEIVGTRIINGKSGNHYEVATRDVVFEEWNDQGLVLGEKWYVAGTTVPKGSNPMSYYIINPEERVIGYFFIILKNHDRWGIFVPAHSETGKHMSLDAILETLVWYRRDGEQPVIENDDPETFYYKTVVEDGIEQDYLERLKKE